MKVTVETYDFLIQETIEAIDQLSRIRLRDASEYGDAEDGYPILCGQFRADIFLLELASQPLIRDLKNALPKQDDGVAPRTDDALAKKVTHLTRRLIADAHLANAKSMDEDNDLLPWERSELQGKAVAYLEIAHDLILLCDDNGMIPLACGRPCAPGMDFEPESEGAGQQRRRATPLFWYGRLGGRLGYDLIARTDYGRRWMFDLKPRRLRWVKRGYRSGPRDPARRVGVYDYTGWLRELDVLRCITCDEGPLPPLDEDLPESEGMEPPATLLWHGRLGYRLGHDWVTRLDCRPSWTFDLKPKRFPRVKRGYVNKAKPVILDGFDYLMTGTRMSVTVGNIRVYIMRTVEGVAVDLYPLHDETDDRLGATWALFDEAEPLEATE